MKNLLFSIGWALWVSVVHCEKSANNSTTSLDDAINKKLSEEAANCSSYIPEKWIQLMRDNQPNDPISHHMHHVPEEYLIACLHGEVRHKNGSSPFSTSLGGTIQYNIAINEVVSLGFDGIFVTKVSMSNLINKL